MGIKIDLLRRYPKSVRNLSARVEQKTDEVRAIARKFDREFFDGDRKFGYGGFSYDEKYWSQTVKDIVDYYKLQDGARILDIGCAKGFMLHDLKILNPSFEVAGIDISDYAIRNSIPSVSKYLKVGNAMNLPFADDSFDLVISINTIHNLDREDCGLALREIQRVAKTNSFITVDAYSDPEEMHRMFAWNLTAKTILSESDWVSFFDKNNYTGDYYWFKP